ncbi:MAG: hypothetical protein HRU03_08730 [Nanoarchaeales archaeon]|nr:hypothetical protein [Nanoarchaeales archaeon]
MSSDITKGVKQIIEQRNLTPTRIISEMSKNRATDFLAGRYQDKTAFALGYEGPHMLTTVLGIDETLTPIKILEAKLEDAIFTNEKGEEEIFEKQGTGLVRYQTQKGIEVVLYSSMDGKVGFPMNPHYVENIKQGSQTRHRIIAVETKEGETIVGFYEPINCYERSQGTLAILNQNGKLIELSGPIPDDTMRNHLANAKNYLTGQTTQNPCTLKIGADIVQTLDMLVRNIK